MEKLHTSGSCLGRVLGQLYYKVNAFSLLEVMGQDYIRTARAKGLSEGKVITRHALRNAMIPIITVLGRTIRRIAYRKLCY